MYLFQSLILPILICAVVLAATIFVIAKIFCHKEKLFLIGILGLVVIALLSLAGCGNTNNSNANEGIEGRTYVSELSYKGIMDTYWENEQDYTIEKTIMLSNGTTKQSLIKITLPNKESISENEEFSFEYYKYNSKDDSKMVGYVTGTLVNNIVGTDVNCVSSVTNSVSYTNQELYLEVDVKSAAKKLAADFILETLESRYYTLNENKNKNDKQVDPRKYGIFPNVDTNEIRSYLSEHESW